MDRLTGRGTSWAGLLGLGHLATHSWEPQVTTGDHSVLVTCGHLWSGDHSALVTCGHLARTRMGLDLGGKHGDGERVVYFQIAWLHPAADGGVTTTARQREFYALGHFGSKTRPQGRGEIT